MSYAANTTLLPDNTVDVNFRSWGSTLSAAFQSMGLTKTGDAGQINWATVSRPLSTSASQGYEMYAFADSNQGSLPVYVKVEYGSGGGATIPGIWITVGTGTNGSGTITGQSSGRVAIASATNDTVTARTCVFSGDTNRIGVAMFTNLASCAFAFFIERAKNSDGSDSSIGTLFSKYDVNSARYQQFIPTTGAVPSSITDTNIQPPVGAASGAFNTDLALYPVLHTRGGGYLNAGLSHVGYFNSDITRDTTFPMTMYNASRTFYALGNTTNIAATSRGNGFTTALAMRYE